MSPERRFDSRPTDGVIVPVEGTVPPINIPTKAGTPNDADIADGAADGDAIVDTSASKLWIRVNGTWKATALT